MRDASPNRLDAHDTCFVLFIFNCVSFVFLGGKKSGGEKKNPSIHYSCQTF